jgi:hypothetical protein
LRVEVESSSHLDCVAAVLDVGEGRFPHAGSCLGSEVVERRQAAGGDAGDQVGALEEEQVGEVLVDLHQAGAGQRPGLGGAQGHASQPPRRGQICWGAGGADDDGGFAGGALQRLQPGRAIGVGEQHAAAAVEHG